MSKLTLTNQAAPATPPSGDTSIYIDPLTKKIGTKDDEGKVIEYTDKAYDLIMESGGYFPVSGLYSSAPQIFSGLKRVFSGNTVNIQDSGVAVELGFPDMTDFFGRELQYDGTNLNNGFTDIFPALKNIRGGLLSLQDDESIIILIENLELAEGTSNSIDSGLYILTCPNATTIGAPKLKNITSPKPGLRFLSNTNAVTADLSELEEIGSGGSGSRAEFYIYGNGNIENILIPKLVRFTSEDVNVDIEFPKVPSLDIFKKFIKDIDFAGLATSMFRFHGNNLDITLDWNTFFTDVQGSWSRFPYIDIRFSQYKAGNINLGSVSVFPGKFGFEDSHTLLSVTASSLTTATRLNFGNNTVLASINLPLLATCDVFSGDSSAALTTLTVSSSLVCYTVFLGGCALDQASVDNLLAALNTGGAVSGQLYINGGTNAIPTGGASNADIVALVGKGWSLSYNV